MTIANKEILQKLKNAVLKEREALLEVLRYLRLVEERKLYLELGFSSLFAYCCKDLGFSETEAYARISAMRLAKEVPELETKIESGEISLTVAAKAQSCFRREKGTLAQEQKKEILASLTGTSVREAERKLVELFPEQSAEAMRREQEKPLAGELTQITFTVTKEQREKFQKLKELMAHKNFEGRYDLLFEALADQALKKFAASSLVAKKCAHEKKPIANPAQEGQKNLTPTPRGRYISQKLKNFVRERSGHQCEYRNPETQIRCESKHALQIDHRIPYSQGGGHHPDNLQNLCGPHNRWKGDR